MLALGDVNAVLDLEVMARPERTTTHTTPDELDNEKAIGEAVFWYLHLRLVQLQEENVNGPAIQQATGISKQQVGQIQRGERAGGLLTLIRFARWDRRSPGQLLDQALEWWRASGPAYKSRRIDELAEQRKEGRPRKRIRSGASGGDSAKARASLRSLDQGGPKVPVRGQKP